MSSIKNKGNVAVSRWMQRARYHLNRGQGHLLRYGINRLRWHRLPARRVVSEFPEHVDLEVSSSCDLQCPMCYTVTERFKKEVPHRFMDWDLYRDLIAQCAAGGAYSVRLSLRGEALLHPRFVEMVRLAKELGVPEVSTLTNNHRLDPEQFEQLVEAGLDWMTISFDGLGETYDSIRWPSTYRESIAKIREYVEIRRRLGSVKPVLKVQSIWPAVADDPQAFFDVFEDLVDEIAVNPIIDYTHIQDPETIVYEEDFTCPVPWQRLVVFSDGRVPMCQNDEFGSSILGDARTTPLREIWHSAELERQRAVQTACGGVAENQACAECYLPRRTRPTPVVLADRTLPIYEYVVRDPSEGKRLVENLEHHPRRDRAVRRQSLSSTPRRADALPAEAVGRRGVEESD